MLKVLEYHFEDDADIAPRLPFLRGGSGNADLANDLQSLAGLYEDEAIKRVIETDQRFMTPRTPRRPLHRQADFKSLGLQPTGPSEYWTDLTRASLDLMLESCEEVSAAGRFLLRRDEDIDVSYPSLIAPGRRSRRSRRGAGDEGPEPISGGATAEAIEAAGTESRDD